MPREHLEQSGPARCGERMLVQFFIAQTCIGNNGKGVGWSGCKVEDGVCETRVGGTVGVGRDVGDAMGDWRVGGRADGRRRDTRFRTILLYSGVNKSGN